MTTIDISVAALRLAYNRGRANGEVAVDLSYCGSRISALRFGRYQKVDYLDQNGKCFAAFQDTAYLDD